MMHTCRIYGFVIMMLMVMRLMVSMRIVRVCTPVGYPGWSAQCWLRPRGRARLEAFSRPSCGCGHSHFDQRCWEREVWLSHFDISRCWEREVFGILVLISRWWEIKVFLYSCDDEKHWERQLFLYWWDIGVFHHGVFHYKLSNSIEIKRLDHV